MATVQDDMALQQMPTDPILICTLSYIKFSKGTSCRLATRSSLLFQLHLPQCTQPAPTNGGGMFGLLWRQLAGGHETCWSPDAVPCMHMYTDVHRPVPQLACESSPAASPFGTSFARLYCLSHDAD